MRIMHAPNWATAGVSKSEPADDPRREYCGIAIAPSSTEGKILVDGVPLQSGRVLPIRQATYSIDRVRPVNIGNKTGSDAPVAGTDSALNCISDLSYILFEDPAELGCNVRRGNQVYSNDFTTDGEGAAKFVVPFVGREMALFSLQSTAEGAALFSYSVVGVRYQTAGRQLVRWVLKNEINVQLDQTYFTYAFYIEDESWDALEFYISEPTHNVAWHADVETIGDIGAE